MQTPESSPIQQTKRQSPIGKLTRKSWNNFRFKLTNKNSPPQPAKSEFVLISANVPPRRCSQPSVAGDRPGLGPVESAGHDAGNAFGELSAGDGTYAFPQPTPSLSISSEPGAAGLAGGFAEPRNVPAFTPKLQEPFEERDVSLTPEDASETFSHFSFERKPSHRYYKPCDAATEPPLPRASGLGSDDSASMLNRALSTCSLEPSALPDPRNNFYEFPEGSSVSDDIGDDELDELIAEANLISDNEKEHESSFKLQPRPSHMHRQLSQVSYDDRVVTFFEEIAPKRTRSTRSTSSSVWPILEQE